MRPSSRALTEARSCASWRRGCITEVRHKQAIIDKLTHEMAVLKRLKFAAKSERFSAEQKSLLEETIDADLAGAAAARSSSSRPTAATPAATKEQPKRQPLPAHLPRREIRHEPEIHVCGCGCRLKRIGEDVAEKLDYMPGVFTVERHIRGKWVCAKCETLVQAPVPAHIIDKGIPTTGLLAQVLVAKYADHLPLYRQEAHLRACGSGDAALHAGAVGGRLRRAIAAAGGCAEGRDAQPACCTPTRRRWRCSSRATARRTGPTCGATAPRVFDPIRAVVFDFAESRARAARAGVPGLGRLRRRLARHAGLRRLQRLQGAVRARGDRGRLPGARPAQVPRAVGQPQQHGGRAGAEVLRRAVRDRARGARPAMPRSDGGSGRTGPSRWPMPCTSGCIAQRQKVPDGSATAKAMDYSLKRWAALTRYLDDGRLPVDNNWVENQIRPIAIGRNNWLFAGSLRAGQRAAAVMSLIALGQAQWA